MKRNLFFILILFIIAGCQKANPDIMETSSAAKKISEQASSALLSSKGGGGGGGGTTTTGLISSIGGAFRLIGGNSDSIQVNFTQAAPATGWIVSLRSSDPAVQLPATFTVAPGEFNIHPHLTSSVIPTSKNVTITVTLGSESKSFVLKVFPLNYQFPAPQLQTPGNGSGFKNRIQVKFQWSDNVNAYYHDIQISDNTAFTNLILEVYLNDPIWAASYFNGLGKRYWRVRYIDGSGTPGPWSETRSFEIKQ